MTAESPSRATPPAQAMTAEEFATALTSCFDFVHVRIDYQKIVRLLSERDAAARQTWEAERAQMVEENQRLKLQRQEHEKVCARVAVDAELKAVADERAALLRLLRDMHKELSEGPTMDDDTWRRLAEAVRK